jgi:hypothetical protein
MLKVGDKIEVLTNEDHAALNNRSKTDAWGPSAEARFCHRIFTVTETVLQRLKEQSTINMSLFKEYDAVKEGSWIMHYADFKMVLIIKIIEVPVYQILKVKEDNITNVLLTPNQQQAENFKKTIEEQNTDPTISFKLITFTIKKQVKEDYKL